MVWYSHCTSSGILFTIPMVLIVLCHVYIYAFNMLSIAKVCCVLFFTSKVSSAFWVLYTYKIGHTWTGQFFLLPVCTDSVQGAMLCVHAWTLSCLPWPYETLYRRQLFPASHTPQIEQKATSEVSDMPMEGAGVPPKRLFLSPNVWMALQPSGADKLLSLVLWVCMQYIGELCISISNVYQCMRCSRCLVYLCHVLMDGVIVQGCCTG